MTNKSSEKQKWYINNGVEGFDLSTLPRCQATAKHTNEPCKRAALKNQKFCGIHSGKYTPGKNKNDKIHGFFTREAMQERRDIVSFLEQFNNIEDNLRKLM